MQILVAVTIPRFAEKCLEYDLRFAICCLLFVVCYLLFAVYYWQLRFCDLVSGGTAASEFVIRGSYDEHDPRRFR